MPQISITFNGTATDLNDFCTHHKYQDEIPDPDNPGETIPNPETKVQFFQRKTKEFVYGSVKSQRVVTAGDAARQVELDKTVEF